MEMPVDPDDRAIRAIRTRLRRWGRKHFRDFPWRDPPAAFAGLVAEVLLTRTRASSVVPVYERFVERYPTPAALAGADPEELADLLRPLGLRWRVPLVHALGKRLETLRAIPDSMEGLLDLPAVGPYAASAFLSFHGGQRGVLVDSNVVRWLARLTGRPYDAETRRKRWLLELADRVTPPRATRDFNYALLDFAMTVCVPRRPRCEVCPLGPALCVYGRVNSA